MKTEKLAATGTFLCLIHCMSMPIMLALLPTTAAFYYGNWAEKVLLAVASVSNLYGLCWGYKKHEKIYPAMLFSVGFTLMAYHGNFILTILGSLSFISSMLLNRYLCRSCEGCNHHGNSGR